MTKNSSYRVCLKSSRNDFLNLAALAERAELYAGKLEREESKIRKLTSVVACGQFCRQGHARRRSTYCSRVQQKIDYQYRLQRAMLNSFQALLILGNKRKEVHWCQIRVVRWLGQRCHAHFGEQPEDNERDVA
ncbi:hypothetical protein TNCV_4717921 [Trichonephila clavipes]|nr:hypothetical protein TNCV_4717921 [Trichonephila clavipes]